MADNLTLQTTPATAPSGTVIATDDAGAGGHVQIVKMAISTDGSATLLPSDATNGMDVDVTRVVPGTTATALGKAEDAAHASGDTGVMALAVRKDTAAALAGADADYAPFEIDANGRLHVIASSGVAGDVAHDGADSGNPLKVGWKARNALPTAVANGDRADGSSDLWGRQLTSHIDPAMQFHKAFNATTTQTGTDVITPTSGKRLAITSVVIGTYGATAGRLILWFGDNADTTYSAGTDQVLLAASFAPSSTSKPGLVFTPAVPVFCTTADRELHCTTDAAMSVDIVIEGYEW